MFGRYLSIWVALCIVAGVGLGNVFPGAFEILSRLEVARVNLVVAVLIWIMIYPVIVNVDFMALRRVGDRPKGLIITVVVNWLIKPFTMAGLFELAVAVAISLFGLNSGAALATVVGCWSRCP